MDYDEPRSTRERKGWLIPYLIALDALFYRRWDYWNAVCTENRIPAAPIPFIPFRDPHAYPKQEVRRNLDACLTGAHNHSHPLSAFVDWILWGLHGNVTFPDITPELDDYWYRTFNLGLFYREPAEHWAPFAADYLGKNSRLGFFATPSSVTAMMTKMTFGDTPEHRHKTMSVCDPCAGTGIMLLHASNYSLNLYGVDISPLLVKICTINAYVYMPWMVVRPKRLTIFDTKPQITEIEFPTGVRIPVCERCPRDSQAFYLDIQTEHIARVNSAGLVTVEAPAIGTDLVNRNLKPHTIHCAHCEKETT